MTYRSNNLKSAGLTNKIQKRSKHKSICLDDNKKYIICDFDLAADHKGIVQKSCYIYTTNMTTYLFKPIKTK